MKRKCRPVSDKVTVRVMADTSYQIKRIMGAVENEKGLELISRSGIRKNNRRRNEEEPFLREHALFKDLKYEKKNKKTGNHNTHSN